MAHTRVDGKKEGLDEMETDNIQHVSKIDSDSDGEYHGQGLNAKIFSLGENTFNPGSEILKELVVEMFLSAEPGMRVGDDYQAAIPELLSDSKCLFLFWFFK